MSFTNASPGYNNAPRFSQMSRNSNSSNGLFLGITDGVTSAGPGSYPGIEVSSVVKKGPSKTRSKTFARRYRDCRPLPFSLSALSLYGADRLLDDQNFTPGVGPGVQPEYSVPESSFQTALDKKGYCSSSFASEQSRFPPSRRYGEGTLRSTGVHEGRKYARHLPKRRKNRSKSMGGGVGSRKSLLLTSESFGSGVGAGAGASAGGGHAGQSPQSTMVGSRSMSSLRGGGGGGGGGKLSPTFGESSSISRGESRERNGNGKGKVTLTPAFYDSREITWSKCNALKIVEVDSPLKMPPPAQFKPFPGWKEGKESPVFKRGAGGGGRSSGFMPEEGERPWIGSRPGSRCVSPAIAFLESGTPNHASRHGVGVDASKQSIVHYSDQGLIERRSYMESPWYYGGGDGEEGGGGERERSRDRETVRDLEDFKEPKKSQGFPNC